VGLLWQRLLGRPVSASGTSCHGDGAHGRGHRAFMFTYPLVLVATGAKMLARRHHAPTIKRIVPTTNESAVDYGADLIRGAFELHVYRRGS